MWLHWSRYTFSPVMPELNLLPAAIRLVEQKNPQGKVKGDYSKCFSVISPSAPVFGP